MIIEENIHEWQQLQSIFDSLSMGVYVTDMDTNEILFVNKFLKDALGKDPTGGLCYKEFQGFDKTCEFCTNKKIKELKGEPYTWEYYNPKIKRLYDITDRVIDWPDGRKVRLEFAVDITKRQEAEKQLRESESRFRELFERALIGIAIVDLEGRPILSNNTLLEMLGYPEDEFRNMRFKEFTHPDDIERDMKLFRDLIKGEREYFQIEKRIIKKNGDLFWGNLIVAIIRDEDDEPIHVMTMVDDITKKKEFEEKLKTSETRFRELFEKTTIGISIIDFEGRPEFSNYALQKMLGYSEEELKSTPFMKFTLPEDLEKDVMLFNEIKEGKRDSIQTESRLIRKDKEIIWANISVTLLQDEEGKPVKIIGMIDDITNRKQAETLLKETTITRDLVGLMFHDLKEIGGLTDRDVFLVGNKLAKGIEADKLEDYLSAFKNMGLGEINIAEIDQEKGRWVFSGENLVELLIGSIKPTDNYALGYLSGAVSKITKHDNIAGVEIECQSMRDNKCKFVIQKK